MTESAVGMKSSARPAFFGALVLLVIGVIIIPSPGSGPELLAASGAMPVFFFGGAFLICGIFAMKNSKHGEIGVFAVAALGFFMAAAGFFRSENVWPFLAILVVSFVLGFSGFMKWRRSRRIH